MKETLTRPEWVIMEALWAESPLVLSEIMERTSTCVDWNSSSYMTYLKRMTLKGYINYEKARGDRRYYPVMAREDCVEKETNAILGKLSEDTKRLLLASMIEKSGLNKEDRTELSNLISRLSDE